MRDLVEVQMKDAGYDLYKIPGPYHEKHLWADGILMFWHHNKRLPTADELAHEMFCEWDDPVDTKDAQEILDYLTGVPDEKKNG